MKEIKFRAWDRDRNKWVSPNVHIDYSGLLFWSLGGREDVLMSRQAQGGIDILQYTGLKDKNGKEIYEGDIFSIPPDKYHNEERNVVEYGLGVYLLEDHGLRLNDWNSRGQVIGNIYENPELLEK